MQKSIVPIVAASLVVAFAAAPALAGNHGDDGDPPDEANYGLCTAKENTSHANETTNGTVHSTPPFDSLEDEDCEDASPPAGPDDPGGDHGNRAAVLLP